jgi:hypothetical protein
MTRRGEILMAVGMAGLAVSMAWAHVVMIGALAFIFGPATLILFLIGVVMVRNPDTPILRQALGIGLTVVGVVSLLYAAVYATDFLYYLARHFPEPWRVGGDRLNPTIAIALISAGWLVPAAFMGTSLRCWTDWPARRCLGWTVAILAVPPAGFVVLRLLMLVLPTSA